MKAILLLLLSFSAMAKLPHKDTCLRQASNYGGKNVINKKCYNVALNQEDALILSNADSSFTAVSWKNVLFINKTFTKKVKGKTKKYRDLNMISGNESMIKEIVSMDIMSDGSEVILLNKEQGKCNILAFKSNRSGNVRPRYIEANELAHCRDIKIHNERIYVLTKSGIHSFRIKDNSRSTLDKFKPQYKNSLKKDNQFDMMTIAEGNFILIDSKKLEIQSFNKDGENDWSLGNKDINLESIEGINYSNGTLEVFGVGQSQKFKIK
jgi:hypothetical protein